MKRTICHLFNTLGYYITTQPYFTHWPNGKRKSTLFHKLQEKLYSMEITLPFSNILRQDIQTKRGAWNLNKFLVNPLHKRLFEACSKLSKHRFSCGVMALGGEWGWTASEWEWPHGSAAARKPTDNLNVRADKPDKSNWLCRFKHIMIGSTLNSHRNPQNKKCLVLLLIKSFRDRSPSLKLHRI